tara:strand:+ start:2703 stop:3674 length:972 start_codon:yes stop_codon:yes gene_type:complete
MSTKILIFNQDHYNHCNATLIEGLIKNKEEYDLQIFCSTSNNYATVRGSWDHTIYDPEMLKKIYDIADIIVLPNGITLNPHAYDLSVLKDKGVFLDTNDFCGDVESPEKYKLYLKREMRVDKGYAENVFPYCFGAEDRYFYGGTNFKDIWNKKHLDLVCMMGIDDEKPWRKEIQDRLLEDYSDNENMQIGTVYGDNNDSDLITDSRNHSKYFDKMISGKISVDGYGARGANNTGRFFESIACGCALFYQTINIHFPNGFVDGEDIVLFHSAQELVDSVDHFLAHPNDLKQLAENAFERLMTYHTTERRGFEFIQLCGGHGMIK